MDIYLPIQFQVLTNPTRASPSHCSAINYAVMLNGAHRILIAYALEAEIRELSETIVWMMNNIYEQ